jgi:hypothetical protein
LVRRHAPPANRPDFVAQVLLDEGDLRLHRQLDVGQRAQARTRRHARQDPPRAFLIHQPARAVDRIDDDHPAHRRSRRVPRDHHFPARQAFRDHQDGRIGRRDRLPDLLDQQVLGHAVDCVDRVPVFLARDRRQRSHGGPLARLDDVAPDAAVERLKGRKKRMVRSHADRAR